MTSPQRERANMQTKAIASLLFFTATIVAGPSFAADKQVPKATGTTTVSSKSKDQADILFDQAATLFDAGKLDDARGKLEAAWALKKSYDIAGNLGIVELKLNRARDAAEHLGYALQNFPPTESDGARAGLQKQFDDARAQVAAFKILVNVEQASVTVNGRALGHGSITDDVYTEPGTVTVEAKREGYSTVRKTFTATKGAAIREVPLTLIPLEGPKPRSVVPGAVLGGVAVVGLATGIGLLVAAGGKHSTVLELNRGILADKKTCAPGAANFDARCTDLEAATSSSDTLHNLGVGFLAGAGAAALGAGVYLLWPASKPTTGTSVRLIPVSTATGGGLLAVGMF